MLTLSPFKNYFQYRQLSQPTGQLAASSSAPVNAPVLSLLGSSVAPAASGTSTGVSGASPSLGPQAPIRFSMSRQVQPSQTPTSSNSSSRAVVSKKTGFVTTCVAWVGNFILILTMWKTESGCLWLQNRRQRTWLMVVYTNQWKLICDKSSLINSVLSILLGTNQY